jgi:hypothetical protein
MWEVLIFTNGQADEIFTCFASEMLIRRAVQNNDWSYLMRKVTRRSWTTEDIRTLKTLSRQKTHAGKIAKKLKRTEGATRQKAFSMGVSLDARI